MAVKALIFDVDGTLAETEEVHRQAYNRVFELERIGWHWTQDFYPQLLAVSGGRERLAFYVEHFAPEDAARITPRLEAIHLHKQSLYAKMIDQRLAMLRPGVERLIEEAHSRGLAVVLTTTSSIENAEALIIANLELAGLEKIDAIVGGPTIAARKPAPDIYLAALDRLGLPARQCVVFEDSVNGLNAAMAAGLRVVVTPSTYSRGGDFTGALSVVSHLGDSFEPYEHLGGAGDGESMVTVAALQRWIADDDDIRSLITIGGRSIF